MKKIFSFFRSMRFGMMLLALILLLSLAGSLIPQGKEPMDYVRAYGASAASVITKAGLDDVFHSWGFAALEILLCGNLVLCSVIRFPAARKSVSQLKKRASEAAPDHVLDPGQARHIREILIRRRYHQEGNLFIRSRAGAYGSFLVHLSILLILVFGTLTLTSPRIQDRTVFPGEEITLEDGSRVECLSFHIEDETGRLDYASRLKATSGDGKRTKEQEIRVNEPMSFGSAKIFQQTYGTAGRVQIRNAENGEEEIIFLTEPSFLSIDSQNGIYFQALYPGFVQEEDGSYTLITSTSRGYTDPVYSVRSISDGEAASVLAFPGETLQNGQISFTFLDPIEYPGLRIKTASPVLYGFLYFSFGLIIVGLYLCFFAAPVCVRLEEDGYVICSARPQEGLELALQMALEDTGGAK